MLVTRSVFNQETGKSGQNVVINHHVLTPGEILEIKRIYGVKPVAGSYWYDSRSGMFGQKDGPVMGVMYPGHQFGTLVNSASSGTSDG